MRTKIIARLGANSAGAATESWETVISSAEREPHARVPGSFRHDHQPLNDVEITTPITPAAVLVPIMERNDGLTVLLTRRTNDVSSHAGQISFPGGRGRNA